MENFTTRNVGFLYAQKEARERGNDGKNKKMKNSMNVKPVYVCVCVCVFAGEGFYIIFLLLLVDFLYSFRFILFQIDTNREKWVCFITA